MAFVNLRFIRVTLVPFSYPEKEKIKHDTSSGKKNALFLLYSTKRLIDGSRNVPFSYLVFFSMPFSFPHETFDKKKYVSCVSSEHQENE